MRGFISLERKTMTMNKIQVGMIDTEGRASLRVIDNTLEAIKDLIKCEWMESLFVSVGSSDFYLLFDEEGKINGLQDTITCFLLADDDEPRDYILGNVLVARFDGRDDLISISKDDFNLLLERLGDRQALSTDHLGRWRIADRFLLAKSPSRSVMDIIMDNHR